MTVANRTFLVTGGAGFIGSHVVDALLQDGAEHVTVVDNLFLGNPKNLAKDDRVEFIEGDAKEMDFMADLLRSRSIDAVFDMAVIPLLTSLEQPRWSYQENVALSVTMAELLREGLIEDLIHFSSSESYGSAEYVPMDEGHPMNPTTPYAASKSAGDHVLHSYAKTFGVSLATLRPFNNYGPRQNSGSYAGVIPITIDRIRNGQHPVLHGDGLQTRDYIYVKDTAAAALAVYGTPSTRGQAFNVCSGEEVTIKDLVQAIADVMEYTGPVDHEPARMGDVRRHLGDNRLLQEATGFRLGWDLHKGMAETVAWYLDQSR